MTEKRRARRAFHEFRVFPWDFRKKTRKTDVSGIKRRMSAIRRRRKRTPQRSGAENRCSGEGRRCAEAAAPASGGCGGTALQACLQKKRTCRIGRSFMQVRRTSRERARRRMSMHRPPQRCRHFPASSAFDADEKAVMRGRPAGRRKQRRRFSVPQCRCRDRAALPRASAQERARHCRTQGKAPVPWCCSRRVPCRTPRLPACARECRSR